MPKLKSNRGAAKRFKRAGKAGFKRAQAFRNHILTKKRTKRKRHLRDTQPVHEGDKKSVSRMCPYI